MASPQRHFPVPKAAVCGTGWRATFAALFVLNYWWSEAASIRIRIFLKTHLFCPYKNISVHTRSVFENIPIHTKTLLHANFDVRTSIKENRQAKCPRVIPKDPCQGGKDEGGV